LIASNLIATISRQKETKNIHQINKIIITQATDNTFRLFDTLKELLENKTNPKEIMKQLNQDFKEENNFIKKFVPKTFGSGLSTYLNKKEESQLLKTLENFLKEEFNTKEVLIINDDKINNAIPTKPLILLE